MSVRKGRPQGRRDVAPEGSISACALLGADAPGAGTDLEIYLPPGLLDDLHDPSLVITSAYVGPERRARSRRSPRYRPDRTRRRPGRWLRLSEVVAVVAATAAAVVPLSLMLAHAPMAPAAAHLAAGNRTATSAARPASLSRRLAAEVRHHQDRSGADRSITGHHRPVAAAATVGTSATAPAPAIALAVATGSSGAAACAAPGTPAMVTRCARVAARNQRRAQRVAVRSVRAARRTPPAAVIGS